jgi:hypothetical protein
MKEETMCNFHYKPNDDQHSIELHGNKSTDQFHAICLDCNVYLQVQGSEVEAQAAKANHESIFRGLSQLEVFSKFLPRCACYTEHLDSLADDELDAEIDTAYEIEEFIETRIAGGVLLEVLAAEILEMELMDDPTQLKNAKQIYQEALEALI